MINYRKGARHTNIAEIIHVLSLYKIRTNYDHLAGGYYNRLLDDIVGIQSENSVLSLQNGDLMDKIQGNV